MIAWVLSGAPGRRNPAFSRLARNASGSCSTQMVRAICMSGCSSAGVKCLTSPKSRKVTRPPRWNR